MMNDHIDGGETMKQKIENIGDFISKCVVIGVKLIPQVLIGLFGVAIITVVYGYFLGISVGLLWNFVLTYMFHLNTITIPAAILLTVTIFSFSKEFSDISVYLDPFEIAKEVASNENERTQKIVSHAFELIFEIVTLIFSGWFVLLSWNKVLPSALNFEIPHIYFSHAIGFSLLVHLLLGWFGTPMKKKSERKAEAEAKDNKENPVQEDPSKVKVDAYICDDY